MVEEVTLKWTIAFLQAKLKNNKPKPTFYLVLCHETNFASEYKNVFYNEELYGSTYWKS